MEAFERLIAGMIAGREWELMGESDRVRELLSEVYNERYHSATYYRDAYQVRVNLQKKEDAAPYAGWITANNPTSGRYQGTSFVWMPAKTGSIAVLVSGTEGFGEDMGLLGRPGHARRLKALSRLHQGRIWVRPDFFDTASDVPKQMTERWPDISDCLKIYSRFIYAAVPVRGDQDAEAVADLLDLFFYDHSTPLTGQAKTRWDGRREAMAGKIFPQVDEDEVLAALRERRYVILEGPPGTGKTRLAFKLADRIGASTRLQFHAARTYEDFVVGLFPRPTADGLAFDVRPGDLLVANKAAADREHLLLIDEINRSDLARVLGEAVVLFEAGDSSRSVRLPHTPLGFPDNLQMSPHLLVLGTRNTADLSVARLDIAIRRRFAFISMWPSLEPVQNEGCQLAINLFTDTIQTFAEFADDETMRLVPGHAYFLDPRPDLAADGRESRVARRLHLELLPLLRDYISEKLCGAASEQIAGLADRIESRLLQR